MIINDEISFTDQAHLRVSHIKACLHDANKLRGQLKQITGPTETNYGAN
jgi:copper chaperone CopZ